MASMKNNDTFSPQKADAFALEIIKNPPITEEGEIVELPLDVISNYLIQYLPNFPPEAITAMANAIYSKALAQLEAERTAAAISIPLEDLDKIDILLKENARAIRDTLASEPNGEVFQIGKDAAANLLVAFTAHALSNYHPSGWIKYDKKTIISLARLNKLPLAEQEKLTQQLHSSFGINMRVVGSAQPIPCYALPWLSSPSEDTPVHLLGLENVYYELQRQALLPQED